MAAQPPQEPGTPRPALSLDGKFGDFDDEEVYKTVKAAASTEETHNFVVEFGRERCRIACNLGARDFTELLKSKPDAEYPIRWINIWDATKQGGSVIDQIATRYGFSERLRETIKTWDTDKGHGMRQKKKLMEAKKKLKLVAALGGLNDVEKAISGSAEASPSAAKDAESKLMYYLLAQELLHYHSIDQVADKFICIGANWLYKRPKSAKTTTIIPPKHWAWYALCCDNEDRTPNTVLTFHEGVYPDASVDPVAPIEKDVELQRKKQEIEFMRSNTVKVLTQLSRYGSKDYETKIMEFTPVRTQLPSQDSPLQPGPPLSSGTEPAGKRLTSTLEQHSSVGQEGSSNLFYYLFEDYASLGPVLIGSSTTLGDLAKRVLNSGNRKDRSKTSDIIPKLYMISKDLRELQHLFESYKMLFQRILASSPGVIDSGTAFGKAVRLAPSARDRFERLGDRLQLLMLNTIQDYLDERKSLSDTYFNLMAQRDSQATARLTRSATLLAKLSVFFLPISFITAYFSIQIPDLTDGYTGKTYWATFGVVAFLSFLSLFFFSRLLVVVSDSLEDSTQKLSRWCQKNITRCLAGKKARKALNALEAREEEEEEESKG